MARPRTIIPPLVPGARLKREEFLRRWEAMPEVKRAELIDGLVYMPSPVSDPHAAGDSLMNAWAAVYAASTPGCAARAAGTSFLVDDAPQPDAALYLLPEYGGAARLEGKYRAGPPELVVEVCLSSASYDLGPKLALYRRAGVREYITLLLHEKKVEWRSLEDGRYHELEPGPDGLFRSKLFPGLWLDPAAAIANNAAAVLEVLRRGLASPEHAAFLRDLAGRKDQPREQA